jgi:tetratricopeptide (TPR) repeat protein
MSINNKYKLSVLIVISYFLLTTCLNAMPLKIYEGGIPIGQPEKLIEEGIRAGSADMLRRAWKHYEDMMSLSGASPVNTVEMGKIYFHLSLLGESTEEDFDTAEFFARQAVSDNPANSDAHRALGLVLAGRGAYLEAMDELTLALHLNPINQMLVYDLAALHVTLHQPERTIELLEGYNHKNGWAYVVLALAWIQKQQHGKAILNLFKARKLGYSGYWIDRMLANLGEELNLPIE